MLKQKDILIISNLRKNARESLTKISKATGIPISTIYDRIKSYENNIINKHTTIVEFAKLGFNTRANIIIKTKRDQRDEIREFLQKNTNLNSVYKINNGYDFLIEAVFRDIKEMEDFIENMESKFSIKSKQVFYIVDDIKRESFLNNPEKLRMFGF